ncbi:MAG: hypothetical protein WA672_05725 [Candidatus Angelobacter sp.]
MQVRPVLILVLFTFSFSSAQSNHGRAGGSAPASLTITATVVPSVWLSMDPAGKQEVMVANSADSKESFSHAQGPGKKKTQMTPSKKRSSPQAQNSAAAPPLQQRRNQSDATVQFSMPSPKQFEVREEIKVMDISGNGKTERQLVKVTTVVPQ